MRIIQFGSPSTALIFEKEIKYLLHNVIGIGIDFFL